MWGDCSWIKQFPKKRKNWQKAAIFFHLLLGRKAMTDLDSAIKSRDITLTTKVRIVFPVVMYRCENWTIGKGEF